MPRIAEYNLRLILLRTTALLEIFFDTEIAIRARSEEARRNEKCAELKYFLDSRSGLKSFLEILLFFGSIF